MQVDVARVGGITPWLKTAHLAETFNIAVCPHFLMELHVALTCAVPNARWLEYIPQLESLTTRGIEIRGGYALPSHAPSLGIAWDFGAIERLRSEGSTLWDSGFPLSQSHECELLGTLSDKTGTDALRYAFGTTGIPSEDQAKTVRHSTGAAEISRVTR